MWCFLLNVIEKYWTMFLYIFITYSETFLISWNIYGYNSITFLCKCNYLENILTPGIVLPANQFFEILSVFLALNGRNLNSNLFCLKKHCRILPNLDWFGFPHASQMKLVPCQQRQFIRSLSSYYCMLIIS